MKHVLNNFDLGQDESNPLLIVIDPFEPQAAKHRFQNPQKSTLTKKIYFLKSLGVVLNEFTDFFIFLTPPSPCHPFY